MFLFGFERSGTTWLSLMVGMHPAIAVPFSTTGLWYRYERALARYDHLQSREAVVRLVDDLLAEERIRLWDSAPGRAELLEEIGPGVDYGGVVASFHRLYARRQGKRRWGNIDIATLYDMDRVHQWFPDARFVHIVRDGRDVALSHETYPYGAANLLDCARSWQQDLRVNLKMGAILGPERYLVIRYEDLVLETEVSLRRICGFIGVEYAPQMLDYPSAVEEKVPESRRWLWPTLNQAPVKSNVYRWRRHMHPTKRIVFESEARALLAELGYEVHEVPPKRLRAYALELLYLLDRGGRAQRIARAVGFGRRRRRVGRPR